ncbi:hypothetical protein K0U27_00755 [archaeon]|nr:hypothetical protein [archaeon]
MGKARDAKSSEAAQAETNQKLYSLINRPRQGTAFAAIGQPNSPKPQNFLDKCGGVMCGPVGGHYSNGTISGGVLSIGMTSGKYAMRVKVSPETGTIDDLVSITGTLPGQFLFLQGSAIGNVVTIKNSGNINGDDFQLKDTDVIFMVFDDSESKWDIVSGSGMGGGGGGTTGNFLNRMMSNIDGSTAINASLVSDTADVYDLGSELLPWRVAHLREIEFATDASVPNAISDTKISRLASGNLAFNNAAPGGGFQYYFEGIPKWAMSNSSLTGDNIILQNSFILNDSAVLPTFNGEFTQNAGDVYVFSGGIARNLSDISDGANRFLSNLLDPVAINTDIGPVSDGVLSLGYPTQSFGQANVDMVAFRHNDGIVATVPSIGRSSASLRLNSPAGNKIELDINGIEEFFFDSLGMKLKNLNSIFFLDSLDSEHARIEKLLGNPFSLISDDGFLLETNQTVPQTVLRGSNITDALLAHSLAFSGRNSLGAQKEYASIKSRQVSAADGAEQGNLEFAVQENGTFDVDYFILDGQSEQIQALKDVNMGFNKISNIGTDTITDLTEETVPAAGDFVLGYEATSGAMRKFDIGNFLGGGTSAHSLDFHDDVTIIAPNAGEYLRYGGSVWSESGLLWADLVFTGSSIDDIADVQIGTPALNTVLKWDDVSSKWVDGLVIDDNIASGANIDISKLNITGTPDGTKFLRDDGIWSDAGGGGGGADFPLNVELENKLGTWVSPVTLNLSEKDGHVWIYDLNKDMTISSVTNIPSSGFQRSFEIEFNNNHVSDTYTVTLPSSFKNLSSFTVGPGQFALLSCRVNDGANIVVVQNSGIISGGGTGSHLLDFHDDVAIIAPNSGEYLRFGGGVWSESGLLWADLVFTGSSIDDLDDVLIGTPAINTVLKWDDVSSNWVDGLVQNANIDASAAIDISKLNITGTPDGTKFLRDDGSWQTVSGGGGGGFTALRAIISNGSGDLDTSAITSAELLNGLTGYPVGPSIDTRLQVLESAGTFDPSNIAEDMLPDATSIRNIGESGKFWASIFGNRHYVGDTQHFIDKNGSDLQINTSSSSRINFDVNLVNQGFFDATGLILKNDLIVEDNAVFQDDVTVGSNDNDDLAINSVLRSDLKIENGKSISPEDGVSEIGIFVQGNSVTIGQNGSLGIPTNSGSASSNALAELHFGAKDGCCGIYGSNGGTPVFVVRMNGSYRVLLMGSALP